VVVVLSADEINLFVVREQKTTLKCWEGGVSERHDDWSVTNKSIAMTVSNEIIYRLTG
jgi:hypothetical protein